MKTFNLPKYSKVVYLYNAEMQYYTCATIEAQEMPIKRLPSNLRLAPAGAANVIPNAARLLLSKECNMGKYQFITGIQETLFEGWFIGNDYEYKSGQKVISLILFHFIDNDKRLEVYYFHQYDKKNTYFRMKFASAVIPLLRKKVA